MVKSKYLRFSYFLFLFAIIMAFTSADFRLPLVGILLAVALFLSIPIYLFPRYVTFRIHCKTSKHLGNSNELSEVFLMLYYLFYSFCILSASTVIIVEMAGSLGFPESLGLGLGFSLSAFLLILIVLLMFAPVSILFFRIMHRLVTKSNTNKNEKNEDAL